jgi:solute carrier family 35 protein C2
VFAFLFRLEKPSLKLILIILAMTLGVLMMVAGETAFHALGFALAISASFFSGFRWALTQILLLRHPATSNPFATMFFIAPIMFVTLFFIACVSETPSAVITGLFLLFREHGVLKALLLLIVPGCIAFCMIASEFTLLQRTSVVTLSICGIFKEVVTISAAGIIFHDELSMVNISGLIVTIISIASYNYLKVVKMREDAREKLKKRDEQRYHEADDEDDDLGNASNSSSAPLIRDVITAEPETDTSSGPASRSSHIANGVLGPSAKRKEATE